MARERRRRKVDAERALAVLLLITSSNFASVRGICADAWRSYSARGPAQPKMDLRAERRSLAAAAKGLTPSAPDLANGHSQRRLSPISVLTLDWSWYRE